MWGHVTVLILLRIFFPINLHAFIFIVMQAVKLLQLSYILMRQEITRSVGVCLQFHHEDVWRSKAETLFSITIVSLQQVKEMSLAQPI